MLRSAPPSCPATRYAATPRARASNVRGSQRRISARITPALRPVNRADPDRLVEPLEPAAAQTAELHARKRPDRVAHVGGREHLTASCGLDDARRHVDDMTEDVLIAHHEDFAGM